MEKKPVSQLTRFSFLPSLPLHFAPMLCYRFTVYTKEAGMADAQLSPDPVRAVLLESHEEFRQLASEHHQLDERIHQLSSLAYPTDQQQFEEAFLKKKKLALKDRMQSILRQHYSEPPPLVRTQ